MASYQDVAAELQCPICLQDYNHPKVMGQCLHSACLECLEQMIATLGKDSFPCPACRQKCRVPPGGVVGLKDDFHLRAIVEKYQAAKKKSIKCTTCSGPASHLCEKCQRIFLCQSCRTKHDQNPLSSAHGLLGICLQHGRTLVMYCKKCDQAICSACMIVEHPCSDQDHDVVQHHRVVDDNLARLGKSLENLQRMQTQKENKFREMQQIQDTVGATMDSDLHKVVQQSTYAIGNADERCSILATESSCLQEQIDALQKQKETVDREFDKINMRREELTQTVDDYCRLLNKQHDAYFATFKLAFDEAVQEMDDIQAKINQAHTQMAVRRVLDGQTVPNLLEMKEKLDKCYKGAELVEAAQAAKFLDAKDSMVRFVPSSDDLEIGVLLRKDISNLQAVAQLSYPSVIASPKVMRVCHVPDSRLVSLCVCRDEEADLADTLCLHDPGNPGICLLEISEDVSPAVDMTITSTGEVMVLRRAAPSIRVFNIGTGAFRDISSCFDEEAKVSQVWAIESDEKGNIFISYGSLKRHLCVLNCLGNVIHDVVQVPHARRMAYCQVTGTLHIACGDVLASCHWDGKGLSDVSSTLHGIDRFWCWDVCISTTPGMFVTGSKKNVIHIYQVKDPDDTPGEEASSLETSVSDDALYGSGIHSEDEAAGKKLKVVRMNFQDKIDRQCRKSPFIPVVSVRGRDLVLGYHTKSELFKITV